MPVQKFMATFLFLLSCLQFSTSNLNFEILQNFELGLRIESDKGLVLLMQVVKEKHF
jgi:hypothetical protein